MKSLEHFFLGACTFVSYKVLNPAGEKLIKESFHQLAGGCLTVCALVQKTHLPNHPTRYHASARRVDFAVARSQAIKNKLATEVLQVSLLV